MKKLSLDALRERAEATASEDLLATISGGTENACHPGPEVDKKTQPKREPIGATGKAIVDWLFDK